MAIVTRIKFTDGVNTVYSNEIIVSGNTYSTYGAYIADLSSLNAGTGEWSIQFKDANTIYIKRIAIGDVVNASQFVNDRATREIRKTATTTGWHDIEKKVFYKFVSTKEVKLYLDAKEG